MYIWGFAGVQRGKYFGDETIRRTEIKARVGKPKNRKATGKGAVTGEMIKDRGDMVMD